MILIDCISSAYFLFLFSSSFSFFSRFQCHRFLPSYFRYQTFWIFQQNSMFGCRLSHTYHVQIRHCICYYKIKPSLKCWLFWFCENILWRLRTDFSDLWIAFRVVVAWFRSFRAENFPIWVFFCLQKWCLKELFTAARMQQPGWFIDLFVHDRTRSCLIAGPCRLIKLPYA